MEVYERIAEQIDGLRLPLFAVSVTALPRANTPVLLMLHWHGFRSEGTPDGVADATPTPRLPVPGSTLQINADWNAMERLDEAILDAAWRLGAWEVDREERRGCNTAGAPEREVLECRQAFGDSPFDGEPAVVNEAPDREEMMQASARIGYVRWQFRPVHGGVWRDTAMDDSLAADGTRSPPCPVRARAPVGTRISRVRYRLGHSRRLILPESARGP
jgi:hypothetical protein